MANDDIRLTAAGKGVRLWQIAEELGIPDSGLSRKLRRELAAEEKARYMEIIAKLSDAQKGSELNGATKV